MERSDQGLPSPSCVIPSNLQSTVSPSCCRAQHSHRYSPSNATISKPCGNTHSLWKIRNTTYGEQLITLTAQEQQLLSTRCSLLPTTVSRWGAEDQMCVFYINLPRKNINTLITPYLGRWRQIENCSLPRCWRTPLPAMASFPRPCLVLLNLTVACHHCHHCIVGLKHLTSKWRIFLCEEVLRPRDR